MKIKRVNNYMALLRNLRNILDVNVSDSHVEKVYMALQHEDAVKYNKLLPFRYYTAYREVEGHLFGTSKVLDAVETALELSSQNIPRYEGTTFLISDVSGSMDDRLSERGTVRRKNVGTLLMSIAHKFCDNAITSIFATDFKVVNVSTKNGIIGNMKTFESQYVGGNTYLYKALDWLVKNKIKVDRIVVFSDMQCYRDSMYGREVQSYLDQYKREINPDVWVHSIDLTGYSTSVVHPDNKVNLIGGFSDRILTYIPLVEKGAESLTQTIDTYYFN